MVRAIIFDLDGTLVNLPVNYDSLRKQLGDFFGADKSEEFSPLIPSIIRLSGLDDSAIAKAFEIMCAEEKRAIESLEIFEGAVGVIEYFSSKGYDLGLVTMQCKEASKKILSEKMEILDKFSSVITRDENHDRAGQIRKTLDNLGISTDDVYVVADRINDAKAASMVGCKCILVHPRKRGQDIDDVKKQLKDTKAEVVEKLADIKQIIADVL